LAKKVPAWLENLAGTVICLLFSEDVIPDASPSSSLAFLLLAMDNIHKERGKKKCPPGPGEPAGAGLLSCP